ncbi:MAG: hypothetical protein WC942_01815 [Clostridia bacterium]
MSQEQLKDFMYKPIKVATSNKKEMVAVIFGLSVTKDTDITGEYENQVIELLDVSTTIQDGSPVVHSLKVVDDTKFVQTLSTNVSQDEIGMIEEAFTIVTEYIEEQQNYLSVLFNSVLTMSTILDKHEDAKEPDDHTIELVSTETSMGVELTDEQYVYLMQGLYRHLISYIEHNLDDTNEVEGIKNNIKMKILELLPPEISFSDDILDANIDGLIDQLKTIQEQQNKGADDDFC